jgi:hypothetical protein
MKGAAGSTAVSGSNSQAWPDRAIFTHMKLVTAVSLRDVFQPVVRILFAQESFYTGFGYSPKDLPMDLTQLINRANDRTTVAKLINAIFTGDAIYETYINLLDSRNVLLSCYVSVGSNGCTTETNLSNCHSNLNSCAPTTTAIKERYSVLTIRSASVVANSMTIGLMLWEMSAIDPVVLNNRIGVPPSAQVGRPSRVLVHGTGDYKEQLGDLACACAHAKAEAPIPGRDCGISKRRPGGRASDGNGQRQASLTVLTSVSSFSTSTPASTFSSASASAACSGESCDGADGGSGGSSDAAANTNVGGTQPADSDSDSDSDSDCDHTALSRALAQHNSCIPHHLLGGAYATGRAGYASRSSHRPAKKQVTKVTGQRDKGIDAGGIGTSGSAAGFGSSGFLLENSSTSAAEDTPMQPANSSSSECEGDGYTAGVAVDDSVDAADDAVGVATGTATAKPSTATQASAAADSKGKVHLLSSSSSTGTGAACSAHETKNCF